MRFVEGIVKEISLKSVDKEICYDEENNFSFSTNSLFNNASARFFNIVFEIKLNQVADFALSVKYDAKFETDTDIDQAFIQGHFVKVNAPAIAYPYLRAFIGTLTLASGYPPAVLPTVNFTNLDANGMKPQEN